MSGIETVFNDQLAKSIAKFVLKVTGNFLLIDYCIHQVLMSILYPSGWNDPAPILLKLVSLSRLSNQLTACFNVALYLLDDNCIEGAIRMADVVSSSFFRFRFRFPTGRTADKSICKDGRRDGSRFLDLQSAAKRSTGPLLLSPSLSSAVQRNHRGESICGTTQQFAWSAAIESHLQETLWPIPFNRQTVMASRSGHRQGF